VTEVSRGGKGGGCPPCRVEEKKRNDIYVSFSQKKKGEEEGEMEKGRNKLPPILGASRKRGKKEGSSLQSVGDISDPKGRKNERARGDGVSIL